MSHIADLLSATAAALRPAWAALLVGAVAVLVVAVAVTRPPRRRPEAPGPR